MCKIAYNSKYIDTYNEFYYVQYFDQQMIIQTTLPVS